MTQTAETAIEEAPDDRDADDATERTAERSADDGRSFETYLHWSLFAVLMIVVLLATFGFYFAASEAINRLVTQRYRPLFKAGFNLAVLLTAGLGLSTLVRRMR